MRASPPAVDYKWLVQDDLVHASLYDNRARLHTRVKLLQTGHRYSQEPPSPMRRLVGNVEVTRSGDGELVAESNCILAELSVQAGHALHWCLPDLT
jgi:benzoate/toluate 1,2-dioxygenase beta subunit